MHMQILENIFKIKIGKQWKCLSLIVKQTKKLRVLNRISVYSKCFDDATKPSLHMDGISRCTKFVKQSNAKRCN